MQRKILISAIILAICANAAAQQADDSATLATVNVIDEAGDTITNAVLIDAEELDKSLADNPHDLLKDISGVEFVKGAGGNFRNITIRGMGTSDGGGDRVAINVDGVPVADSFRTGHATDNGQSYFDIADLKAVEVKKGASIITGGYNGLAGTVNFTTKDPVDYLKEGNNFGGNVRAGYSGMDDAYNGGVSIAGKFSDTLSGMFSYTYRNYHEIENYDGLDVVGTDRTAKNPMDADSNNLLGKIVFSPSEDNQFKLKLENYHANSDTQILDKAQSTSGDYYDRFKTRRKTVSLSQDVNAKTPVFDSAHWQLYYQDSKQNRDNDYQSDSYGLSEGHTYYRTKEMGADVRVAKQIANNTLGYGFRLRQTDVTTRLYYYSPSIDSTRYYQTQPNTTTKTYSAFVNDDIALAGERFHILPAVELTHYKIEPDATENYLSDAIDVSQTQFSWSLGTTFDITDNHQLFASYRQGLRVPSMKEQNPGASFHGTTYIPNANLKPEKSKTAELGIRSNGRLGSQTVSLFHDTYQDRFETERDATTGVYQSVNNPNDVTIYGIEYQGELNLGELGMAEGLKLKGGLTYTKAREETDSGKQPYSAADPLNGHVGVAYDAPSDRWGVEWMTYFSAAKKAKDISDDDLNASYGALSPIGGYGVSNLTAYFRPIKDMQINAGVYNVFDKRYAVWSESQSTNAYYQSLPYEYVTEPGRTFAINFRYDF